MLRERPLRLLGFDKELELSEEGAILVELRFLSAACDILRLASVSLLELSGAVGKDGASKALLSRALGTLKPGPIDLRGCLLLRFGIDDGGI